MYQHTSTIAPNPLDFARVVITIESDPKFVRKFGKRVKAALGTYDECRGSYTYGRQIWLPIEKSNFPLIEEILASFKPGNRLCPTMRQDIEGRLYRFEFLAHKEIRRYDQVPARKSYKFPSEFKAHNLEEACEAFVRGYERAIGDGNALPITEIRYEVIMRDKVKAHHATLVEQLRAVLAQGKFDHKQPEAAIFAVHLRNDMVAIVEVREQGYYLGGISQTNDWRSPHLFDLERLMRLLEQLDKLKLD